MDSSIYGALVRLSQPWVMRYPLIDFHGSNGNQDGDDAAAYRYTEARLSKIAEDGLLCGIKKEVVDFMPNYSETMDEPVTLPSLFPNLLCNPNTGIGVAIASNWLPHNLTEVANAIFQYMDGKEPQLIGPDFPTGGLIINGNDLPAIVKSGRGSVKVRGKYNIEKDRNIVFYEIPYGVQTENLMKQIGLACDEGKINGVSDIRNESNRKGYRLVIECSKDASIPSVLTKLFSETDLQTSISYNQVALVDKTPTELTLKQCIEIYINHNIDCIIKEANYDKNKINKRLEVIEGLLKALEDIDNIILLIKTSASSKVAKENLINKYGFSENQAQAILDMKLSRLAGLEKLEIQNEKADLLKTIDKINTILSNPQKELKIRLADFVKKYGDERRTEISDASVDMEDEDLIPVEDVIITLTESGYIKRQLVDTYRAQNRGGRGIKSLTLNEEDSIDTMISMSTHDFLLLFTDKGRVYRLKGYNVPSGSRTSKGIPIVNLMTLEKGEKVNVLVAVPKDDESETLLFVTKNGIVKRTSVSEFENINRNGKIAISLKPDDELRFVKLTTGQDEVIISGSNGKAVRFNEDQVRIMGRSASGVLGFNCDGSEVVGAALSSEGDTVLVVSENGYGKRSKFEDYRLTSRGKKGVSTINITEKTGKLMCMRSVTGKEDAMIVASDGIMIRVALENVGIYGRNTQGVRLINLNGDAKVTRMTLVDHEEPEAESEENTEE